MAKRVRQFKLDTVKVKRNFTKHMMKKNGGASVVRGVERRVKAAQRKLAKAFESHPITREIESGPEASKRNPWGEWKFI